MNGRLVIRGGDVYNIGLPLRYIVNNIKNLLPNWERVADLMVGGVRGTWRAKNC